MKLVIFGLTISSSWGNGHATIWRALCRALARRGHRCIFFERDLDYYAAHRDCTEVPGGELILYREWEAGRRLARRHLADAEAAVVTSYCPDGIAATELVLDSKALKVFYDLDTPVTLERLAAGAAVSYIGPAGLRDFDLVLSFGGGKAIEALRSRLGARQAAPLYGAVDPEVHYPAEPAGHYRADLSYVGTYSNDRQPVLDKLFLAAARRLPERRFLIAGSMYPAGFGWLKNVYFVHHVAPPQHAALYSSCRLTLNVTRRPMARMGHCPPVRLFEAAACGVPLVSDRWSGIEDFFEPGREILLADDCADTVRALALPADELRRIGLRARDRALSQHSAARRALELEDFLAAARRRELCAAAVASAGAPEANT